MGIFHGLKEAKTTQRNVYVPEGNHLLKYLNGKQGESQMDNYKYLVFELEVVESDNPTLKPKQVVSYFLPMKKDRPWQTSLKNFLGSLAGVDPQEIDEADAETALSAKNPLAGMPVRCSGVTRPTKKDPARTYVYLTWRRAEAA